MPVEYLKHAPKTAASGEVDVQTNVQAMLNEIEAGGEGKAIELARHFDKWEGEIVVSAEDRCCVA